MTNKVVFSVILATILCHLSLQMTTTSTHSSTQIDYSGCDTKYQCFKESNDLLLKTIPSKTGVEFTFYWLRDANSDPNYAAVGLSEDTEMGDDSVTLFTFVGQNSTVSVEHGITYGHDSVDSMTVHGISDVKVQYSDGLLIGQWSRAHNTTVLSTNFNIKDNEYYVMLVVGRLDGEGSPSYHSTTYVSDSAVNLERDLTHNVSTVATSATTQSTSTHSSTQIDYSGCDTKYQCFKESKELLVKTLLTKTGVEFTFYWLRDANSDPNYAAVGLSEDTNMGDDSVTLFTFVGQNSTVSAEHGITDGHEGVDIMTVHGISEVKVQYSDGLLIGQWSRAHNTTVRSTNFNIKDNEYYVMLVVGRVENGNLGYHPTTFVSDGAVNLERDLTQNVSTVATSATTF